MTYYVYELIDPRSKAVFYVGKGKGRRLDDHELEARGGRQSRKCDTIREIEAAGLRVRKTKVRTFSDEQEAYDFEAELVCQYGLENLTNLIKGGGTARTGYSVYHDRLTVKYAAEILTRTKGRQIKGLIIMGEYLDLSEIVDKYIERASQVIRRRGVDFANRIAARFSVKFVNG